MRGGHRYRINARSASLILPLRRNGELNRLLLGVRHGLLLGLFAAELGLSQTIGLELSVISLCLGEQIRIGITVSSFVSRTLPKLEELTGLGRPSAVGRYAASKSIPRWRGNLDHCSESRQAKQIRPVGRNGAFPMEAGLLGGRIRKG